MRRESSIKVINLNIAANPHPKGTYEAIFRRARQRVVKERYRASDFVILGDFQPLKGAAGVFCGVLYVFTEFDKSGSWLNEQKLTAASPEEMEAIKIPKNLKPNFRMFSFVFDVKKHQMFLEVRNKAGAVVAPQPIATAIRRILQRAAETETDVNVTVRPEKSIVDKILNMSMLRTLVIDLKIPNADDESEIEQEILDYYKKRNIKEAKLVQMALPKKSIILDKTTKNLARAASKNGYVEGNGKDDGIRRKISTRDRPKVHTIGIRFDQDAIQKIARFFGLL